MNPQTEQQIACHPSVRRWIFLRAFLIGLLVAAWWIMFAPDSLMESSLKITLGVVAGLVATGSYLFNLRKTLYSQGTGAPAAKD
ncbi:MAG: hypothetical protein Q8N89_05970 [Azonexus sp.]|nr:hypothetical protein [Azonexus sp.]